MKDKLWYAAQVILSLQNDYTNIDTKIDEREVLLRIDAVVNDLAKKDYFENWRLSGGAVDEQYITTWDSIEVQDQLNGLPSYLDLPSNYVALPMNGGIETIAPVKWTAGYESGVIITTFSDYRRYQNNPAGNMQGRLTGYPIGSKFYFTTCDVGKKVSKEMIVRLVIRDSSMIADDQPYPIPADKENLVIATVVAWYRERRAQPTDEVRDNRDQA